MDTDASDLAIGAELLQIQDGKEKVVVYGNFSVTIDQRKYCTTRKELLAVVSIYLAVSTLFVWKTVYSED